MTISRNSAILDFDIFYFGHESSSCVKLRLHTENQLTRCPGYGLIFERFFFFLQRSFTATHSPLSIVAVKVSELLLLDFIFCCQAQFFFQWLFGNARLDQPYFMDYLIHFLQSNPGYNIQAVQMLYSKTNSRYQLILGIS